MELQLVLSVLALLFLMNGVNGNLYGVHLRGSINDLDLVQIDPLTGSIRIIANISFHSDIIPIPSCFDQVNQELYFLANTAESYPGLVGANVITGVLSPVSYRLIINWLAWDSTNNQILGAVSSRDSIVSIGTFQQNGGYKPLSNLSAIFVYGIAVDNNKGIVHFPFYNETSQIVLLAQLSTASPSEIKIGTFSCAIQPAAIFFDSNSNRLLGVGYGYISDSITYFEIDNSGLGVCQMIPLYQAQYRAATFDPTTSSLYVSYISGILVFDTESHKITNQFSTTGEVMVLEVSYKL